MSPKMTNLLKSLPFVLLALAAQSAAAQEESDHYAAISNTAMSITGDIWMDDTGITFENDEYLEFSDLVADKFRVDGKQVPGSVYKIAEPADPVLLNGNRLCGSGKVTYLANWASSKGMSVVAVFTGKAAPKSSAEMCASYTYEDPQ